MNMRICQPSPYVLYGQKSWTVLVAALALFSQGSPVIENLKHLLGLHRLEFRNHRVPWSLLAPNRPKMSEADLCECNVLRTGNLLSGAISGTLSVPDFYVASDICMHR